MASFCTKIFVFITLTVLLSPACYPPSHYKFTRHVIYVCVYAPAVAVMASFCTPNVKISVYITLTVLLSPACYSHLHNKFTRHVIYACVYAPAVAVMASFCTPNVKIFACVTLTSMLLSPAQQIYTTRYLCVCVCAGSCCHGLLLHKNINIFVCLCAGTLAVQFCACLHARLITL
jgi:hypothetical protein